jgi:hypothetical protein
MARTLLEKIESSTNPMFRLERQLRHRIRQEHKRSRMALLEQQWDAEVAQRQVRALLAKA